MIRSLKDLRFRKVDVEVYFCLARMGPQKGRNLSNLLGLHRQRLYRSLKRLQRRGIVFSSAKHPVIFSAIPFENVLDLFLEEKREQAKALIESKDELLSSWRSIVEKDSANS
jgi:sugar-specific transcriptional regulator TrmB